MALTVLTPVSRERLSFHPLWLGQLLAVFLGYDAYFRCEFLSLDVLPLVAEREGERNKGLGKKDLGGEGIDWYCKGCPDTVDTSWEGWGAYI